MRQIIERGAHKGTSAPGPRATKLMLSPLCLRNSPPKLTSVIGRDGQIRKSADLIRSLHRRGRVVSEGA